MAYYLNLFSPETYLAFTDSNRRISGFRLRQRPAADKIKSGDKFVCYLTKLSRWVGLFEVAGEAFEDSTPIFVPDDDPFTLRFNVRPLVWLAPENSIPIHASGVWDILSFTKDHDARSSRWTGRIRASLAPIDAPDGRFLERLLLDQLKTPRIYPLDDDDAAAFQTHTVRRADKTVAVTVPTEVQEISEGSAPAVSDARESIKMQALLAEIGSQMGLRIWVPKADRGGVLKEWKDPQSALIDRLPLNYDDTTLKTIEQIDILWLRGRSIVRAFEVEHTTSVYSGLLRMADLLALQPNMNIKLHIVAPAEKREKVFQEIRRPVFSLLERGPLSELCSYLSYDALKELAGQRHLAHLSDTVVDEYAEDAD